MRIARHAAEAVGPALAARVAEDLHAALARNGRASLAVPGGTTPAPFLRALADTALDWARVTVTLTDERCVAPDHGRSNARLVRAALLTGAAAAARFVPLHDPPRGVGETEAALRTHAMPLDVCVLGMGADMHTASLFPGAPGLADALDPRGEALLARMSPPDAEEDRITLTLPPLAGAAHCYLLITGPEKLAALESAMAAAREAAPIRAVMEAARDPVIFHGG